MRKSNNNISDWLDENGDPEIDIFIEKSLLISEKIKPYTDKLKLMGHDLDKWTSGMYNFTIKDIIKIEQSTGIKLLK